MPARQQRDARLILPPTAPGVGVGVPQEVGSGPPAGEADRDRAPPYRTCQVGQLSTGYPQDMSDAWGHGTLTARGTRF